MNNHRGSLPMALLLILILTGLSAAILLRSVSENRLVKRDVNSTSALWTAEAGLQKAIWEYTNNSCHGMVQVNTATACSSCTSCGGGSKTLAGTLSSYGDYDITLNAANTLIQSVGSVPDRSSSSKIQRRVQAALGTPAIFANGLFANGSIVISNNALVDSYNSSSGSYGGGNIHANGNVGTNGSSAGIVSISNNADVLGNIGSGVGGTVTIGGGATISGSITHSTSVALPAVVVPPTLTSLASGGTYSLSNNQSKTINAGDYKYTAVSFANNGTLTINGNVRLYLTGATALNTGNNATITITSGSNLTIYSDGVVTFGNNVNINTASHLPSNLLIYSTYTGANGVTLNNNGATYAAIYAPQTDVNVSNNSGFYGAVVGKTTILDNNGEIHYDEALATMANPFENAIASSWQEY